MRNYVQPGEVVEVPTIDAVKSGDGVLIGSLFGVAAGDAEAGGLVRLNTLGVFDLPKAAGDDLALGDRVYWAASQNQVVKAAQGNKLIGVALAPATTGAANVRVRLNGAFFQ